MSEQRQPEGPYRDLGNGFARLTGSEGVRRAPSRIETVEDALLELVRNSADAGASSIHVASTLRTRRYRELVVLDDGCGVPESHRSLIFEPGVTTRHLAPPRTTGSTHGSGLSLHHIREAALSAEVVSTSNPTSVKAVFDTESLTERSLQSGKLAGESSRGSRSNLLATLQNFRDLWNSSIAPAGPRIYYGSPASITALLKDKHIIQSVSVGELESWCEGKLGARLSRRTLQRIMKGRVSPARMVESAGDSERGGLYSSDVRTDAPGIRLAAGRLELDERDLAEIEAIIERAASESYLAVERLRFESRDGEITLRAKVYEAEDEYGYEHYE